MSSYAIRTHQTTVTLAPGETQLFRLPPTTRGTVIVRARVAAMPTSGPIGRRTRRDHRGPASRARSTTLVATRIRDHRDLAVDLDDIVVDDPTTGGGSTTPTDLTLELLLGGSISKATHSHLIVLDSDYTGEVWQLRLTRREGGAAEQTYVIEATYPSVLPVLSREIGIAAFQRAFDANWNQHPYVTMEMKNEKFYITFDEQFRQLYGLENHVEDLSWVPTPIGSIPDFQCSVRFRMGIAEHPVDVNGRFDAPVMIVDARSTLGIAIKLEFFLEATNKVAGFVARATVSGISDEIDVGIGEVDTLPFVDIKDELEDAIDKFFHRLPRHAFGKKFTPWLVGEARRELLAIQANRQRRAFTVKWVGPRKPPSAEPVVSEGTDSGAPRPEPPPYLFDTPDETPPPPIDEGLEPRRPYITTRGPLEAIQNVVVLMMENRSFDQVLGYLSRDEGRTDVDGLSPDDERHREDYPENRPWYPRRAESTSWDFDKPGPIHHLDGVLKQIAGGEMNKFVANFDERAHGDRALLALVKAYFGPEQLPAYRALTEEFAICDRWFTPHPGPTWPNRFIAASGDLNRDFRGQVEIDNPHLPEMAPAQALTIFDHLGERGLGWRVYEHGYSFLRLYGRYTFETERIVDFRHPRRGFVADARAGRLPPLTWIEPDYVDLPPGNDDHPPADMADGQKLVATVVSALLDSPQWENTLLVITYDEHGGFYDHVPPPDGPALSGGDVRRGPRVPAFVVSPWVARGAVSKTVYDHTSIMATVLRAFCSPNPPRTSARADAANDLRDLIQPTARPRSDFDALHRRLAAISNRPSSPTRKPPLLEANPEPDDFHAVMRYVRSFT